MFEEAGWSFDNDGLLTLITANSNTLEHLDLDLPSIDFASICAEFKNLKTLSLFPYISDTNICNITNLIKQAPKLETLQGGQMNFELSKLSQSDKIVESLSLSRLKLGIMDAGALQAALIVIRKSYKTLKSLDLVLENTSNMEDLLKHCQSVEFLRLEFCHGIQGLSSVPTPPEGKRKVSILILDCVHMYK